MTNKIYINKLRRGVKLLTDHIYTGLAEVMSQLTDKGITYENLDKAGTFRVNYYCPVVGKHHRSETSPLDSSGDPQMVGHIATMPFVLPPLQGLGKELGPEYAHTRPNIVLEEISVGFDQRNEPQDLKDWFQAEPWNLVGVGGPSTEGSYKDSNEGLGLTINIRSKVQQPGVLVAPEAPEPCNDVVYSLEIPNFGLTQDVLRFNPLVKSNLDVAFDPYKTYLIEVAPDGDGNYFSLLVSLKFKHKLVPPERGFDGGGLPLTPNMPAGAGDTNTTNVATTTPASNTSIQTEGAGGLNTELRVLDSYMQRGIRGGYTIDGVRQHAENIVDSSSYEVIAVNLYGGHYSVYGGTPQPDLFHSGATPPGDLWNPYWQPYETLPYVVNADNPTMDWKVIRLHYPFILHHVVAAANYALPGDPDGTRNVKYPQVASVPQSTTLSNHVGVALFSGIRSDRVAYTQLAELAWVAKTSSAEKLDQMDQGGGKGYLWELTQIPLVGNAGHAYNGVAGVQGKPIWCGGTKSDGGNRPDVPLVPGAATDAAPATAGEEQAIEIRWSIKDTVGFNDAGSYPNKGTIVGLGGHWIFLYGKKALV